MIPKSQALDVFLMAHGLHLDEVCGILQAF